MKYSWTKKEIDAIERYFKTTVTKMTLFQRLHKMNPHRSYESMGRKLREYKQKGFEKTKQLAIDSLRIGYLDIETTNLAANFGHILSWYIKPRGKNTYHKGIITKKEIFNYSFDKRILKELLVAFDHYDVLYTHYGSDRRFDLPFIRTRAFANGLEDMLPNYMDKFIMDTYPIARNKLRLHSNRLSSIAEALGVKDEKTVLSPAIWMKARVGDASALKYVALHNKKDVDVLEAIHIKLEKVERPIYRSM